MLTIDGNPLANVTLSVGPRKVLTDNSGRFLIPGLPSGAGVLLIDGTTADNNGRAFGIFHFGGGTGFDFWNYDPTAYGWYAFTRTHLSQDTAVRPFGTGWTDNYELYITNGGAPNYTAVGLVLPDGEKVHYVNTVSGSRSRTAPSTAFPPTATAPRLRRCSASPIATETNLPSHAIAARTSPR